MRWIRFLQARAQLLCLFLTAAVRFTQLVLNRFELRPQIRTPLCVGELRRDIFLQSLLYLGDLELRRNMCDSYEARLMETINVLTQQHPSISYDYDRLR